MIPPAANCCRLPHGDCVAIRLQVDRSKDQLYFASEASLSYLDGSQPGDFGEQRSDPQQQQLCLAPASVLVEDN